MAEEERFVRSKISTDTMYNTLKTHTEICTYRSRQAHTNASTKTKFLFNRASANLRLVSVASSARQRHWICESKTKLVYANAWVDPIPSIAVVKMIWGEIVLFSHLFRYLVLDLNQLVIKLLLKFLWSAISLNTSAVSSPVSPRVTVNCVCILIVCGSVPLMHFRCVSNILLQSTERWI